MEPQSGADLVYPIRHGVTERWHEYAPALDYQARQRLVHRVESRLAKAHYTSEAEFGSAKRPDRGEAPVDVQVLR